MTIDRAAMIGARQRDERAIERAWRWLPLRSVALGLSPTRILIGVFTLVVASLVGRVSALWEPAGTPPVSQRLSVVVTDTVSQVGYGVRGWNLSTIESAFRGLGGGFALVTGETTPVLSWAVGLAMLTVVMIGVVGAARSAAVTVADGPTEAWPVSLAAGVSRGPRGVAWLLLVGGVPILGLWLIGLLGAWLVGGEGTATGAVVFGPVWLLSIPLLLALIGLGLATPLVVGALACESTDGLDAIQRGLAFVVARPISVVVWLVTGGALVAIAGSVAAWTVGTALDLGLTGVGPVADSAGRLDWGSEASSAIPERLEFWRSLALLAVAGFVFAMIASVCTTVYMRLRLVIDGHSPIDL